MIVNTHASRLIFVSWRGLIIGAVGEVGWDIGISDVGAGRSYDEPLPDE